MRNLLAPLSLVLACTSLLGCGDKNGPKIFISLNAPLLCNRTISGVTENRCDKDEDCTGTDETFCYKVPASADAKDPIFTKGFCRQCETTGECPSGECDHGWCHQPCTGDPQCTGVGEVCTGGFCRPPFTQNLEFVLSNKGNRDLQVYTDQTKLYGNDDACVFARYQWSEPDTTITVEPEGDFYLAFSFTPTAAQSLYQPKKYLAYVEIYSNSIENNPLQLLFTAYGVEAACLPGLGDDNCPACINSEQDFKDILKNLPTPTCP